jgi:beta-lactamase regulating signal transducer with metallopeptidase domain/outer membrane biosynthesis protein TonB
MTLWIAWTALISALIAIAAAAVVRVAAYLNAPRRFVWMIALIASAIVPLIFSLRTAPAIASSIEPAGRLIETMPTNAPLSRRAADEPPITPSPRVSAGIDRRIGWREAITNLATNARFADAWIMRAWALTSLIVFLAFVRATVVLRRHRSQWRDLEIEGARVLVARDAGPAVVGFVRPRIVIPEWALSIERATRDLLLRHELEHIRAGDSRALLAAEVLLICAPWNAALWWMARQLRLAIEIDCDARVIRARGRTREYALVLLAVGERHASAIPLAASLSEPRSNLEARIDAMTAPRPGRPVVASLPMVSLAAAVIATSAWVPRPMPLLRGRARPPREPVARPFAVKSQSIGDTSSRVLDSSTSTGSATHGITAASVDGQRATVAHADAAPTFRSVEQRTAETSAAQPVQGNPAPRYPESLRDAHVEGVVFVVFSTDAGGVPDTATIRVVASTNDLFRAEVRNVLPRWRLVANDSARFAFRFVMEQGNPPVRYDSIVPAAHNRMGTRVDRLLMDRSPRPFVVDGLDFVPVLITGVAPSATQQREPTWKPSWFFLRDLGHPLAELDPKPLPGNPAPRYPDALRGNGTEGFVVVTFSTDARGIPDTTTINVIRSTNDQFTNAVRRVLPNWRFDSAGRVRLAFRFMTRETEQKESAARYSPTFTIEGVAALPVVVVLAIPANKKPLDAPQPISIGAAGASPARHEFDTRAELEAQATAAEKAHRTGEAWLLRTRLEKGDFQEGDRILVEVEGANIITKPETLVVQNGKNGKHLELPRMADLSLEGVLRAELQERLTQHLAQYIREPVVRATPLVPERDHGDHQMILSKPLSAAVDTIAARLASLEIERLSWLAGEPTSGAPQNEMELQIRSLREQLRRLPERDSATRFVDARVAAALDARESELKGQLQQLRLVYTDNYPTVKNLATAERLVEERKAELRRTKP